jgi:hypothetical protein
MVLHDFLSKRLAPLQDRSHRPTWMYTGVNDIMRMDHGFGSSLSDTLLAASLKALTTDQPSAELVTPAVSCEPLCVNQAAKTTLLAIMPTLDDVDIALVQRGDQSRGVVIPGLGGAAGGHGHGSVPTGGGLVGSRSGAPAGGRGGVAGDSSVVAPSKGKQTRDILDDDEVSSDEDELLQKRMRQLSGAGPAVRDEAAVDKRAVEEAAAMRAAERAAEEASAKRAAEEAAVKKATRSGPRRRQRLSRSWEQPPGQAPSAAGAKRSAAPCGPTPPAKRPYRGV